MDDERRLLQSRLSRERQSLLIIHLLVVVVVVVLRGGLQVVVGAREEALAADVLHNAVVQQVLDAVAAGNEAPGHRRADLVRDPVRDECDVASVLGELVRVEDELLRIRAAPCDDDEAVMAQDGVQLEGRNERLEFIAQ